MIAVLNELLDPIRERFSQPDMVELTKLAYPPEDKKKRGGGGGAPAEKAAPAAASKPASTAAAGAVSTEMDVSRLDIRVGKIVSVEMHPNADSMYVEKIDVGEPEPRVVVSGLVGKVEKAALENRSVLVLCNLKPANLRSIKSHAMLLAASDADGKVECLDPPAGAAVGERITVEGFAGAPDAQIKPGSSKKVGVWETVQKELLVEGGVAKYKGVPFMTSKGPVTTATLTAATIK